MGDHIFLKVMPKRVVVRFGKRGKLSLRYIETVAVTGCLGANYDKLCIKCMLDMKKVGNDREIRVHKVNL